MFTAKDIQIKVIDSASSRKVVERYHYSGKCTQNSQIHFGVFLNGKLEGALQFGPSIDKRRMAQNLGIGFNESLELNRMALSDNCPKNSESRSLGICLRLLKKNYPHLKIIISFADACQCGDGIIYRASGFRLHSYKVNNSLFDIPENVVPFIKKYLPGYSGGVIANKALNNVVDENGKYLTTKIKSMGAKPLNGYQMKYLYFFDKGLEKRFKFVDFDKIPDNVKMYKGSKRSEHENNVSAFQVEESGATPTTALHFKDSYE
jgi:hypothetical protein